MELLSAKSDYIFDRLLAAAVSAAHLPLAELKG
jgi:hypothetical protein